jgi:prepilin-type N-terminal cleavage/methylation domain-containing protein
MPLFHSRRRGFTFIELLVALSLFSVGFVSVLQIFPVNRRLLAQSSFQTQAAFLVQEQIENLRSLPYTSITVGTYEPRAFLTGTSASDPVTQFERSTTVSLMDGTYATTATDVGLKKIVVTVYWSEHNIPRQYSITTYANNI